MFMNYKLLSTIAIICLLSINQQVKAQSFKGKFLFEGNIGNIRFSKEKPTQSNYPNNYSYSNKIFSGILSLRVGYFISNAFVIGTGIDYSTLFQKSSSNSATYGGSSFSSTKMGSLGISPFVRYYFIGKTSKNKLYMQIEGKYNRDLFNTQTSTDYNANGSLDQSQKLTNTFSSYSAGALLGFNHFFNDNVAFNTNIGYSYGKILQTSSNQYTLSTFGSGTISSSKSIISHTLLWNFGFTLILGGKHKEEAK
jgi:hypothetical protein